MLKLSRSLWRTSAISAYLNINKECDIDKWLKRLKDISEKEQDEIASEIWAFALAALVHPEDFDDFPEGYDSNDNIKKAYFIDYVRTDLNMLNAYGYGKR